MNKLTRILDSLTLLASLCLVGFSSIAGSYAPVPKGFKRQDMPFPWEMWAGKDGEELWRSTTEMGSAPARRKKLLSYLRLDAVLFEKVRTRTGKAGFGGVLVNYKARYSEDEKWPKDSIAVWTRTDGKSERIIVTKYSEPQRKKSAELLTEQLAAEAKAFLR